MSCPDAAGTITGGPPLDVSITDRSATLPAAVPDGPPLFCEHFMARHILCFHITGKFVLSLSRRPPRDSLNDVVQLRVLAPSPSGRYARCEQTLSAAATHTWTRRHTRATRATGDSRVGSGGEALCWEKGKWGGLNSSLSELHDVVMNNRYHLGASNSLNSDAKRIYNKTMSPISDQQANLKVYIQSVLSVLKKQTNQTHSSSPPFYQEKHLYNCDPSKPTLCGWCKMSCKLQPTGLNTTMQESLLAWWIPCDHKL